LSRAGADAVGAMMERRLMARSTQPSQPEDFHGDFRMHWVPPKV
jgi:hypothetical protein